MRFKKSHLRYHLILWTNFNSHKKCRQVEWYYSNKKEAIRAAIAFRKRRKTNGAAVFDVVKHERLFHSTAGPPSRPKAPPPPPWLCIPKTA